MIARRQTDHGSGLGRDRWVVERTFAWLHNYKRLVIRYERRADMHHALGSRKGVRTLPAASGPDLYEVVEPNRAWLSEL